MQQVDRNNPDPLERIACPFRDGPEPPNIVKLKGGPKTNCRPKKVLMEIHRCSSPGPIPKPGFIRFLLTPEDTTDTEQKSEWMAPIMEPRTAAGMTKAFFWIVIAILFSLMLAQLH